LFSENGKYDEAKLCLDRSLLSHKRISSVVDCDCKVTVILLELGRCSIKLFLYDEAKGCFEKALQIIEETSSNVYSDRQFAIMLYELGCCVMKMCKYDEAYTFFY